METLFDIVCLIAVAVFQISVLRIDKEVANNEEN